MKHKILKLCSSSDFDLADSADELDSCALVDIEDIFSPDIIKKTGVSIIECWRAVFDFDEQARQDESSNEYDPDQRCSIIHIGQQEEPYHWIAPIKIQDLDFRF